MDQDADGEPDQQSCHRVIFGRFPGVECQPNDRLRNDREKKHGEDGPCDETGNHPVGFVFTVEAASTRISIDFYRTDCTGARFEGGARDAAEATDRFVDEPGGVGAGVVAEDLAPYAEESDQIGVPVVVESDEPG